MNDATHDGTNARRLGPVGAFIVQQPAAVRELLVITSEFLHEAVPGLREGIKWRIPTFMLARNLFYLNPQHGSGAQMAPAVVLGFCNGAAMVEFFGVFDRVQAEVAHVVIRKPEDLSRAGLREAVRAAAGLPAEIVALNLRSEARPATYETEQPQP